MSLFISHRCDCPTLHSHHVVTNPLHRNASRNMESDWLGDLIHAGRSVEPPPASFAGDERPRPALNRSFITCHWCNKSKNEGVALRQCSACETELYCVSLSPICSLP